MSENLPPMQPSCPNCGGSVSADSSFCMDCGVHLSGSEKSSPRAAALGAKSSGKRNLALLVGGSLILLALSSGLWLWMTFAPIFRDRNRNISPSPGSNPIGALLGVFTTSALTNDKAQRAIDRLLDWTKKGGEARVMGIRETPEQNMATVDVRFTDFQYNANSYGNPVPKDQTTPQAPSTKSPNYWEDMMKHTNGQVRARSYTGEGVAIFKHYNDGRWVLTSVHFGMFGVSGEIQVR
jgi:hypothetical protein